jgi:hypothetical protein
MLLARFVRRLRPPGSREDVCSTDGSITFNWLQQSEAECATDCEDDVITTDPNGITDG